MRMISWPGAKYRCIGALQRWLPQGKIVTMCEPFWGTGALTFAVRDRITRHILAGEANEALRWWWGWMFLSPWDMVDRMRFYRNKYKDAKHDRSVFLRMRQDWNAMPRDGIDSSALLWCLIYASTNNLARFNKKGEYNQTWGKGRSIPDPVAVFNYSTIEAIEDIKNRVVMHTSFEDCLDAYIRNINKNINEFETKCCYLDPPYILQSGMYDANQWDYEKLERLMEYINLLEEHSSWWLYTDYMQKGDDVHPFADMLKSNFRQIPINSTRDARPAGTARNKLEVITIGSVVEENILIPQLPI